MKSLAPVDVKLNCKLSAHSGGLAIRHRDRHWRSAWARHHDAASEAYLWRIAYRYRDQHQLSQELRSLLIG
jgi:hypothetical protein